jgi:hypothetical protein
VRIAAVACVACGAFPAAAWADPAASLNTPPANATTVYAAGAVPPADFSCTPDPASTLSDCSAVVDSLGPRLHGGDALPDTLGPHTILVTATDADGGTAVATGAYDVENAPAAAIAAPVDGQNYAVGQAVPTSFTCTPGHLNPGALSCSDSGGATGGTGALDTAAAGPHTYSVTAGQDTLSASAQIHYTVMAKAPIVSVTEPVGNGDYFWQSVPAAAYGCSAATGAVLQSCAGSSGGTPVATGGPLPDTLGTHTLTVTATDTDGQTSTRTVTYAATLVLAPPVSIQSPAGRASYRLGQSVLARYSCGVQSSGSPLRTCTGTVPSGHAVDTRTLGVHAFSAKATDASGQSSTESITYRVIPTTNRFTVSGVGATGEGVARLTATLPGPGRLAVVADAWSAGGAPALRRHFVYATVGHRARAAGRVRLRVTPDGRGRALLKTAGAVPVLALAVTYTPTGARAHVVRPRALRLRRPASARRSSPPTGRR